MTTSIGKGIVAEVTANYGAGILSLSLDPQTDLGDALMPAILERLMHVLMEVAQNEFNISGKYNEIGKPKPLDTRVPPK